MQYFKNVELTKLYPVSEAAVRKWISAAQKGKVDLQLYEQGGKVHIANTSRNQHIIEELVEKGKKYRNSRGHKAVSPTAHFYKLYTHKQVLDIISNLEIYHEIPHQYSYFDGGARYWDDYAQRLITEETPNTLNSTVELLRASIGNLDDLLEGYDRVNIVDLGVGNALPIKEVIAHLLYDNGVLGRYIGIDISNDMLKIAEKNIAQWFEGRVDFEGKVCDFTHERFDRFLTEESITGGSKIATVVFLLGDTLSNFRYPDDSLRTICNSMGRNDLFVYATKLDSDQARRYFDFNIGIGMPQLSEDDKMLMDNLNIDESMYDVEQTYDPQLKARHVRAVLKIDITLNFKFPNGVRQVELHKGDGILLWRAWHQSVQEVLQRFDRNGFALLHASVAKDRHYLLTINEVGNGQSLSSR